MCGVCAEELPVYLVQGLGLQDGAADDAAPFGSFHDDLEAAEEHVEIRLDAGRVARALNGEGRAAFLVPVDFALVLFAPDLAVGRDALVGEVEGGIAAESLHRWTASGVEWVAVGVSLSQCCRSKGCERRNGGKREGFHVWCKESMSLSCLCIYVEVEWSLIVREWTHVYQTRCVVLRNE